MTIIISLFIALLTVLSILNGSGNMTIIIGLFIALPTVLNVLNGSSSSVLSWNKYFRERLERPEYRLKWADDLTSNALLNFYQDWLEHALDWLDDPRRMGSLNTYFGTLQGFNVCLAVAAAYSALTIIIGWMFGGSGSMGNTNFLPAIHSETIQFGLGAVLLSLSVVAGLALARGKDIDAGCVAWLTRRLYRFRVAAGLAEWLYRLASMILTAVLWSVAALHSDLSGAVMVGVAVSGTTGVASAAAGTGAGAIAVALPVAAGVVIGGTVTGAVLGVYILCLGGVVVLPGTGAAIFAASFVLAFVSTALLLLASAGAVAVTAALSGAVAVAAGVIAMTVFRGDGFRAGSTTGAVGGATAAAGTIAVAGMTGHPENPFAVALLLFAVILPVMNAVVDWVSWWVSRKLGRNLLALIDRPLARGQKFMWLTSHIIVNLVVSIILLYVLALTLSFVIELFNLWCRGIRLAEPLPLVTLLGRLRQRPLPDGIWVMTMLLTTLVPTVLHAMVLIASPLMAWLHSDEHRKAIADGLRAGEAEAIYNASWLMIRAWLTGIGASVALFFAFIDAISVLWRPVSGLLLDAAYFGMACANQVACRIGWPSCSSLSALPTLH